MKDCFSCIDKDKMFTLLDLKKKHFLLCDYWGSSQKKAESRLEYSSALYTWASHLTSLCASVSFLCKTGIMTVPASTGGWVGECDNVTGALTTMPGHGEPPDHINSASSSQR